MIMVPEGGDFTSTTNQDFVPVSDLVWWLSWIGGHPAFPHVTRVSSILPKPCVKNRPVAVEWWAPLLREAAAAPRAGAFSATHPSASHDSRSPALAWRTAHPY